MRVRNSQCPLEAVARSRGKAAAGSARREEQICSMLGEHDVVSKRKRLFLFSFLPFFCTRALRPFPRLFNHLARAVLLARSTFYS